MNGRKKPASPVQKCPGPSCKLVSLTVIRNATQNHVTGAKNWATVKKATDDVIVEATTTPNTEDAWKQINWSGDSGAAVPGKPNQRSIPRGSSKKYHVEADLGGVKDHVDVWVLWATVTILAKDSDTTPPNSAQFGTLYDGTEKLGARSYSSGNGAAGKVAPFATITPPGIHDVVKSGWAFKRERISHDWIDGVKNTAADYWNTTWVDDTSLSMWTKLTPDADDKIYDLDGPNVQAVGSSNDYETYNNFRQWIEWNSEKCSDYADWYWQGRWKKSATPQVTLKEVGIGNIKLPDDSYFHPPAPPPAADKKGCFIATAAYGSPLAPQVQFLRELRDQVLRKTNWGHRFFEEYWEYYYQISPAIAARMEQDPQLKGIVQWSIVTPMVNYLKLLIGRPKNWEMEHLDPEWREFLIGMKQDMDALLAAIELPEEFNGLDNDAIIDELNIALDLVLREPEKTKAYLDRLVRKGVLPLPCAPGERARLEARLGDSGRSATEINKILHGIRR